MISGKADAVGDGICGDTSEVSKPDCDVRLEVVKPEATPGVRLDDVDGLTAVKKSSFKISVTISVDFGPSGGTVMEPYLEGT